MIGAGSLAVLAAFCIMRLGSRAMSVYAPIAFPLGCAISVIVLQVSLHSESLMEDSLRQFVVWILSLFIVQSLCLSQGFLHRFAVAAFTIGLTVVPYLQVYVSGAQYQRFGLDRTIGGLANPNDLAAWFGFCSVYFIILGIETKRAVVRVASWLVAIGCLYIIGLTLSRGPLFASAIAVSIALRRLLKRGFLPVLFLMILCWLVYESGLFERIAAFYTLRSTEETGRLLVWPLVVQRFLSAPLTGVGMSNIATPVSFDGPSITPHSGFLFIALASGIIPLAFFVAYWWRAAWGALRAYAEQTADTPFCIPLLIYAFLITLTGNLPFMAPWVIVTLSTAMTASALPRRRLIVMRQVGKETTA
jgi:O-antigen ligase